MSERVEQMFSQLRRGPWNADPMSVPQEGFGGNGNIESQGWLSDGSVTADVIQANAVIAGKVDADAVTAREIAANTITAAEIAANTITAAQIAANTITAAQIAASTITASEIAANTITASEIAADSITTSELAANAVITENILAGNVVSSKIELTVSGKNFGANSGSTSAPGVYFDAASSVGLSYASGAIIIATGAGVADPALVLDSASSNVVVTQGADLLYPANDNSVGLGVSGGRWIDVWAVDGTINTSDERLKQDIADTPLGLAFVRRLRPVMYRWRDTVDTQARENARVDQRELDRACRPIEDRIREIRAQQTEGSISDERADREVEIARVELRGVIDKHAAPVRAVRGKRRAGKRFHYGLIAQEVKAALDAEGLDAAFWKQSPNGEQSLAYSELIAPLVAAIQELAARVEVLERR